MEKLQLIKALKQMAAYSIVVFQPAVRVPYFTFKYFIEVKFSSAKLKKIISILYSLDIVFIDLTLILSTLISLIKSVFLASKISHQTKIIKKSYL